MRVLKLGAIDLDAGVRVAEQRLRHRLNHARLARAGRPEKEEIAYRTPGRIEPRQKHLVDFGDLLDRGILPDDLPSQCGFKFKCVVAMTRGIQNSVQSGLHNGCQLTAGRMGSDQAEY